MNHSSRDQEDPQEPLDNDQLDARLRSSDPAAVLAPLGEDDVRALLALVTDTARGGDVAEVDPCAPAAVDGAVRASAVSNLDAIRQRQTSTALTPGHLTRRQVGQPPGRYWLIGLAGLGIAAAATGVLAISLGASPARGPALTALQAPAAAAQAPPVPGGPAASTELQTCAPLTTADLEGADTAFKGEVTGVEGNLVTLRVELVYRGQPGREVHVTTGPGSVVDATLSLQEEGTYLVAATAGVVAGCGATGLDEPDLEQLYEQAFGGGS